MNSFRYNSLHFVSLLDVSQTDMLLRWIDFLNNEEKIMAKDNENKREELENHGDTSIVKHHIPNEQIYFTPDNNDSFIIQPERKLQIDGLRKPPEKHSIRDLQNSYVYETNQSPGNVKRNFLGSIVAGILNSNPITRNIFGFTVPPNHIQVTRDASGKYIYYGPGQHMLLNPSHTRLGRPISLRGEVTQNNHAVINLAGQIKIVDVPPGHYTVVKNNNQFEILKEGRHR